MMEKSEIQKKREKEAELKREIIHEGKFFTLTIDRLLDSGTNLHPDFSVGQKCVSSDGNLNESCQVRKLERQYDLVIHPGAAVMIPVSEKGDLIFIRQWRYPSSRILIEFPAGKLEKDEDPLVCASRELQEEIGCKAEEIIPMGGFFTAPGFCTEYLHLYIARKLKPSPLIGDDTDEIDIFSVSLQKAIAMIERGKIIDAKTIVGIYRYEKWIST